MGKLAIGFVPNKSCSLVKGISLRLDCGIQIGSFDGDHFLRISRFDPSVDGELSAEHKSVVVEIDNDTLANTSFDIISSALCFTLNFFGEIGYVSQMQFYFAEKNKVIKIKSKHEYKKIFAPSSLRISYKLKKSTTPAEFEKVFVSCCNALKKDKGVSVTVDRYIQSLSRNDIESKVVDLSICLESLFPFTAEIKFRFALFGALFASNKIDKRKEIYEILKNLYDLRSKIVHGASDTEKLEKKILDKWEMLLEVARYSILYKFAFIENNSPIEWQGHLDDVALTGGMTNGLGEANA